MIKYYAVYFICLLLPMGWTYLLHGGVNVQTNDFILYTLLAGFIVMLKALEDIREAIEKHTATP